MTPTDHDLLIELHTRVLELRDDIKEIKDDMKLRIDKLETEKLDSAEATRLLTDSVKIHDDHEKRIRRLERLGFIAIGGLAIIQLIIDYLLRK